MAHEQIDQIQTTVRMCDCDNCTILSDEIIELLNNIEDERICLSQAKTVSVILDHIAKHKNVFNILLRIIISSDINNTATQYIIKMTKRNTTKMGQSEIARQKFTNEIMFYKTFAHKFTTTICVEYYILDIKSTSTPILLMRDLTEDDYRQFETKLSKAHLQRCIQALACFHANGTKLMNENADLAVQYYENSNQLQAISSFLNSSFLKTFSKDIEEKITQKLNKGQEQLLVNRNNSVLVHGSLTRSNIFFKEIYDNETVKFIDFETVSLGSPAIDVGRLLFTNLPIEYDVNKLEKFCKDILNHYMVTFMTEYPTFDRFHVYENIINNLIYSYVNLDETEKKEVISHNTLVNVLDSLGSLD